VNSRIHRHCIRYSILQIIYSPSLGAVPSTVRVIRSEHATPYLTSAAPCIWPPPDRTPTRSNVKKTQRCSTHLFRFVGPVQLSLAVRGPQDAPREFPLIIERSSLTTRNQDIIELLPLTVVERTLGWLLPTSQCAKLGRQTPRNQTPTAFPPCHCIILPRPGSVPSRKRGPEMASMLTQ